MKSSPGSRRAGESRALGGRGERGNGGGFQHCRRHESVPLRSDDDILQHHLLGMGRARHGATGRVVVVRRTRAGHGAHEDDAQRRQSKPAHELEDRSSPIGPAFYDTHIPTDHVARRERRFLPVDIHAFSIDGVWYDVKEVGSWLFAAGKDRGWTVAAGFSPRTKGAD